MNLKTFKNVFSGRRATSVPGFPDRFNSSFINEFINEITIIHGFLFSAGIQEQDKSSDIEQQPPFGDRK